jgi:hypothetical protein
MGFEIISETENLSVANLVEAMILVNIDVSIWSAKRKMKPEDFGDISLPPEKLATLGSKNIFDPSRLDPFTRVRSEAYNFMRRIGIRFGSGFIVAEDMLPEITDKLETLKREFMARRDEFLASYDAGLREWVDDPENLQWNHIIVGSMVDETYVANRLRYRWHALKVTPAAVSDLAADVADLPNLLFEEVADCARDLLRTTCADGRDRGVQKSLNPFRTLRNKLEGLSFVDPLAAALAEGIDVVLSGIPAEGALEATAMQKLRQLANKLSSPSSARAFAKTIRDGGGGSEEDDQAAAKQADDYLISLPQPRPAAVILPLPAPVEAPAASTSVPGTPQTALAGAVNAVESAIPAATAPAAPVGDTSSVDLPFVDLPADPLTNDDLDALFGEETRQMAPAFNVPEDLLRKAMGL